jgi:hypothetical protein
MAKRFPVSKVTRRLLEVESELQEWIAHYSLASYEYELEDKANPFLDRVSHLVEAASRVQAAAFELTFIKRS